jgi:hypothetical protein
VVPSAKLFSGPVALLLLLSGCTAPSPYAAAFGPDAVWAHEYVGVDEMALRIPELPVRQSRDDRARVIVARIPGERLRVSLVDSKSRDVLCVLAARSEAGGAAVEPNQLCFGTQPARTLVRGGKATFDDTRLRLELHALVEMQSGDALVDGEMNYRFEGE